jgi:hypothetical protein
MRKIIFAFLVISFSGVFAVTARAQQNGPNDKFFELQEQWQRIMQSEYNPSTIQPKVEGHSFLYSASSPTRQSRKTVHGKSESHGR